MSYTKQGFIDGETLKAEKLNHMEEGIEEAHKKIEEGGGGGTAATTSFDDSETNLGVDNTQDAIVAVFQYGSSKKAELVTALQYSGLGITEENTWEQIFDILAEEYPGKEDLYPTGTLSSGWSETIDSVSLSVNNYGASDPYTKSNTASRYCSVEVNCEKYTKLKINCTITQSGTGSCSIVARLGTTSNGTDIKTINLSNGINEIDISDIYSFYLSFYITNTCSGTNVTHSTTFKVNEMQLVN